MIDIGIMPLDLAHKKSDQHEGNALVNIIFDRQDLSTSIPLKINRIIVSTEKAFMRDESESSTGPKTLYAVEKQGTQWHSWRPGPEDGGLPASFVDEQCMMLDPRLAQGSTDFEGQEDYAVYGNNG